LGLYFVWKKKWKKKLRSGMISFLPKKGTRVRNLRLNEPLSNILATAIRQIHPGKKKLQHQQNKTKKMNG